MKKQVSKIILSAALIVARVVCQGQVYSPHGISIPHQADEINLSTYGKDVDKDWSLTEWYVSTNILAKQLQWNVLAMEAPLSIHQVCALALTNLAKEYPQVRGWSLETVELRHPCNNGVVPLDDYWYFAVHFKAVDHELENDIGFCPMQIVLLDGTVVPPKMVKNKK